MSKITVSSCNLNQHCLDFKNNLKNIIESVKIAKSHNSQIRVGPELEICGYSCEDHYLEIDTVEHSWLMIEEIIKSNITENILCSFGMPVIYNHTLYNCIIYIYNNEILLIRPKKSLCSNGNYRETRYFTPWTKLKKIFSYNLPLNIVKSNKQKTTMFGDAIISFNDIKIGTEMCEELWAPNSPNTDFGLQGVHIICNSSASHHQLKKLQYRTNLIKNSTSKNGGIYIYSNLIGCDGNRLYFDGLSLICCNGKFLSQCSQFSMKKVEVSSATINVKEIDIYRSSIKSRGVQASNIELYPEIKIDVFLCNSLNQVSNKINIKFYNPMEEIALGPALWLWDYLRKSGLSGFFLPLSGGSDSSSTATIVYSMCKLLFDNFELIKDDLRRIVKNQDFIPKSAQEICSEIFYTCYMSTPNNSENTRSYAKNLALAIGANHSELDIQEIVDSYLKVFDDKFNFKPKFKTNNGSYIENLSLQNLQARIRMVLSYFCSQLLLTTKNKSGGLLVLGSSNADEALMGYYTKYDCSSADLNPIGSFSKINIKKFLKFGKDYFKIDVLQDILDQKPTAELEPITSEYSQTDEEDIGITYQDISYLGMLRKEKNLGPVNMVYYLIDEKYNNYTKDEIKSLVKKFYKRYSINRHKMTTLTPSYHGEDYSPDDNRHDLRPFLYNTNWELQNDIINSI